MCTISRNTIILAHTGVTRWCRGLGKVLNILGSKPTTQISCTHIGIYDILHGLSLGFQGNNTIHNLIFTIELLFTN